MLKYFISFLEHIHSKSPYLIITVLIISACSGTSYSPINTVPDDNIELKNWQYRWGDSPADSNSNLAWLHENGTENEWIDLENLDQLPDRDSNTILWIRTSLPLLNPNSHTLFLHRVHEIFEIYVDETKVFENADFNRREEYLVHNSGWYLIDLPHDINGKTLTIRIFSQYRGIGIPPPVVIGSSGEIIKDLFLSHLDEMLVGFLILVLAVIFLIVLIFKQKTLFNLGITVFFFALGIFMLGCTPISTLIIPLSKLDYYCYNLNFYFQASLFLIIESIVEKNYRDRFRWFWRIHFAYFICAMLITSLTGLTLEDVMEPFILMLSLTACYTIYILILSAFKGNSESKILLLGVILFITGGLFEFIIYYNNTLTNNYYLGFQVFHWGGFIFVLSILGVYGHRFFYAIKQRELSQEEILHTQENRINTIQHEKDMQKHLSQKLINIQDEERRKISSDLHDAIGQEMLFISNMALLTLRDKSLKPESHENLIQISSIAKNVINEIRDLFKNLYPYHLESLGLKKALEAIINRANKSSTIVISSNIENVDRMFSRKGEVHIYRILQECVSNLIKHSKATNAEINLYHNDSEISLNVMDNGVGFDSKIMDKSSPKTGVGLPGILERVEILNGKIKFDSRIKTGTSFTINIPVRNKGNNTEYE